MKAITACGLGLQLCALSALVGVGGHTLVDSALALPAAGLAFFIGRNGGNARAAGVPLPVWALVGIGSFIVFRLVPFGGHPSHYIAIKIAMFTAVGLSLCTCLVLKGGLRPASLRGPAVAVALAGLSVASIAFWGFNNEYDGLMRWSSGLFWLQAAFFAYWMNGVLVSAELRLWSLRFFKTASVVLAVVAAVGGGRVVSAAHTFGQARASFAAGEYGAAADRMAALAERSERLGLGNRALDAAFARFDAHLASGGDVAAWMAYGDMAAQYRFWPEAKRAYAAARKEGARGALIRFKHGQALYETGEPLAAIDNFTAGGSEFTELDLAALSILYVRMRDWPAAHKVSTDLFQRHMVSRIFSNDLATARLAVADFVPEPWLAHGYFSLADIVRLLQVHGGAVWHPGTGIGRTGVRPKVDIEAYSGGGNTWLQESIQVDGKRVSPESRGYNIAVVDDQTGAVEDVEAFDTWENAAEGARLADYLRQVPYSKVVVGTVRDEGSGGLGSAAKEEFGHLGVKFIPPKWGSHSFIGVKGAIEGGILEAVGKQDNPAVTRVLAAKMPKIRRQDDLVGFLREEAVLAPGKFAVYLSGVTGADTVVVVKSQ